MLSMVFYSKAHRGIALLEVLIAVVVLAIGLLALASFQGGALRSGSDAKNRTVATAIAQDRMEILRGFDDNSYDTLVVDGGPQTITRSGTNYSVSWAIDGYAFADENVAATLTGGDTGDFKKITVTVSWTDERDSSQNVTIESYINSSSPGSTALALNPPTGGEAPKIPYNPGTLPIIPIEHTIAGTGTFTIQEATTPEPEVDSRSGTSQVTFEEITYGNLGGNNVIFNRDENRTVNCVCEQVSSRTKSNGDPDPGLNPTIFDYQEDGVQDDRWRVGDTDTVKAVGVRATGNVSISGTTFRLSDQPEICDICCRDHHDNGDPTDRTNSPLTEYYDPFRHSGSGDHDHFFPDNQGNLALANSNGDLYLEACRFIRVDGLWRVTQDWRLEGLQVLTSEYLQNSTNLDTYRTYVKEHIEEYILDIDVAAFDTATGYPSVAPQLNTPSYPFATHSDATIDLGTDLTNLPNSDDEEVFATSPTGEEVQLSTTNPAQSVKEFLARGLYIDFMDEEHIKRLKCKINGSAPGTYCADNNITTGVDDWLAEVPFHEVNVSLLGQWSNSSTPVTVTDDSIPDGVNPSYSRGEVTAQAAGLDTVVMTIERSNTGVVDTAIIDPTSSGTGANTVTYSNPDNSTLSDALDVEVDNTSTIITGFTISGTIDITNNAGAGTDLQPSDIVVSTPTTDSICVKPTQSTYVCTFPNTDPSTGLPYVTLSVEIIFSGYNYTKTCNGAGNTSGTAIYDNEIRLNNSGNSGSTISADDNSPTGVVDQTVTEQTTFVFTNASAIINHVANMEIRRDGGEGTCQTN